MIHAQGIIFDTNTDIIIDLATLARLLRLNTQNLSRFYVKTKSYKTNSFHSAKNACFPGKKRFPEFLAISIKTFGKKQLKT